MAKRTGALALLLDIFGYYWARTPKLLARARREK